MKANIFRGKRIDNKEWVYGGLITNINHKTYIALTDSIYTIKGKTDTINACIHEVEPNTVGQYTGLNSSKGVYIYDGDIIVVPGEYPFFDDDKSAYVGIVEWIFSGWQFVYKCVDNDRNGISNGINNGLNDAGFEENAISYYEIIGNIHELDKNITEEDEIGCQGECICCQFKDDCEERKIIEECHRRG